MNITSRDIGKIKSFLDERYQRVDVPWVEYLNKIDCDLIDDDDILDEFENLFNNSSKTRICIPWGANYILMPKELAEKALVLGGLPDSWFLEKPAE